MPRWVLLLTCRDYDSEWYYEFCKSLTTLWWARLTEQMTGVAIVNQLIFVYNLFFGGFQVRGFLQHSFSGRRMTKAWQIPCGLNFTWE